MSRVDRYYGDNKDGKSTDKKAEKTELSSETKVVETKEKKGLFGRKKNTGYDTFWGDSKKSKKKSSKNAGEETFWGMFDANETAGVQTAAPQAKAPDAPVQHASEASNLNSFLESFDEPVNFEYKNAANQGIDQSSYAQDIPSHKPINPIEPMDPIAELDAMPDYAGHDVNAADTLYTKDVNATDTMYTKLDKPIEQKYTETSSEPIKSAAAAGAVGVLSSYNNDPQDPNNSKPSKRDKKDKSSDASKAYKKARKGEKRKHGMLRKILIILAALIVAGGIAGCVYAAVCIASAPVIHPENIYETLDLGTNIYDDEGNQVDSAYYLENRKITKYEEMPENLVNAFIAIEDKTFWKHHGFNFKRIIGAVLGSLTNGSISGTSTITQQLARNVYLSDIKSVRSIKRKIIEMYYAYQIEQALSKEQIIEAYLNTIYLGYGNYGVSSAAKSYFSTDVGGLTLEQCAALAALPQAPDSYALIKTEAGEACTDLGNGFYANDISYDRRDLVLDLMVEQGLVTADEANAARKPLTEFIKLNTSSTGGSSSYFKDYLIDTVVADLMEEYGKTEQEARNMIYTKGLKIYSTLDSTAQSVIIKEFKKNDNFPKDKNGDYPEAAMVVTEVGTGQIKAMVGGRNSKGEMLFNRAINARQPGSSIKPLAVYSAALQKSLELQAKGEKYKYNSYADAATWGDYITTSSQVPDTKMTVDGKVWPKNSNNAYTGANTFRTAIQQSINTCAVKILMQVGIEYSAELVKSYGISTLVDDESAAVNDMNLAALALGGMSYGVKPLEMALAYGAFVNEGKVNTPICYTKVEDGDGNVILEGKSETTQVLDPGVAWIMCDVLQSVVTKGIAKDAKISKVQSGGKTGTTNDQYDIWFDGFTPTYTASLWIGTDKNVALTTMSGPAAKLWGKIMNQIPKAKTGKYKDQPSNVNKIGKEYYTKGTEPTNIELNPDGTIKTDDDSGHGYDEGSETTLDQIINQ